MPDSYSPEKREKLQSYLLIHLKKEELSLAEDEQIEILQKKNRKQGWFLGINIAAILFFGYSFYFGITQLGNTLLYILIGVFVINLLLIFYQRSQLRDLIKYLKWKEDTDEY